MPFCSELNGFVNSRVLRRFCDEQLIKTKTKNISKLGIDPTLSERTNQKIEQSKVSQHAVEKLDRKGTIGRLQRGIGQEA